MHFPSEDVQHFLHRWSPPGELEELIADRSSSTFLRGVSCAEQDGGKPVL